MASHRFVNAGHFAIGIGHHSGFAIVSLQTNLHVQGQGTQVVHLVVLGHFLAAISAKDVLNMTAVCTDVNRHVFDNAQNRHAYFFKHLDALFGIQQSDVLGCGHNHGACHGHALAECELNVTRARRHVDDQIIQVFPIGLSQ